MMKVLISLCLVASLFGLLAAKPTAELQAPETFIIGGNTAPIASFPYHVSVQRFGSHICSGVIYGKSLILTTASCVWGITPTTLRIRAGSATWNQGGILANVFSAYIHEAFNPVTKVNDIALMRLTTTLTYSTSIQPIPLAFSAPADDGAATISGFGVTASGSAVLSNTLQAASVRVISRAKCLTTVYGNTITNTMFCAADGVKAACDGDTGSPLVAAGQLIGLYSWSNGCGVDGYPGVFTDITVLRLWVTNTVANNVI